MRSPQPLSVHFVRLYLKDRAVKHCSSLKIFDNKTAATYVAGNEKRLELLLVNKRNYINATKWQVYKD